MRVGVYKKEPARIEIQDMEIPKSDGQRVIIKVGAAGICGSDLTAYKEALKPEGVIFGHEYAGTVVDIGSSKTLKVGDRVVVCPTNECGVCPECLRGRIQNCLSNVVGGGAQGLGLTYPGGFSQYVWALPQYTYKLPDNLTLEHGAMVEPMAVSLRAVHQAGIFAGSKVLITGAGFIGISAALLARFAGASYIALSARTPSKAKILLEKGIVDAVFDSKEEDHVAQLKAACGERTFDFALECTGSGDVLNACVNTVRPAGRICLVGLGRTPIDVRMMTIIAAKELTLIGSMAYTIEEFISTIDIIASGKIDVMPYITKRVGIEDIDKTFKELIAGGTNDIKVMVNPWS